MISKQQRRLLFLFIIAFGVLTVPVILILIKLVPPDEVSVGDMVVAINTVTAVVPANQSASPEPNIVTDRYKSVPPEANPAQTTSKQDAVNGAPMQRAFIAGNWVVVDCGKRIVLQCPHRLISTGTSPRFGKVNKVFMSHCRDVSISIDSFCRL